MSEHPEYGALNMAPPYPTNPSIAQYGASGVNQQQMSLGPHIGYPPFYSTSYPPTNPDFVQQFPGPAQPFPFQGTLPTPYIAGSALPLGHDTQPNAPYPPQEMMANFPSSTQMPVSCPPAIDTNSPLNHTTQPCPPAVTMQHPTSPPCFSETEPRDETVTFPPYSDFSDPNIVHYSDTTPLLHPDAGAASLYPFLNDLGDFSSTSPVEEASAETQKPTSSQSVDISTEAQTTESTIDTYQDVKEISSRQRHGTVAPFHPFHPKEDAEKLKKAMKGIGTDEKAIIHIIANRSWEQRIEIAEAYKELFGKELVKQLKSELSGKVQSVIRALMMPRSRYLAKCIRRGVLRYGSLAKACVDILCTSTNAEIHEINDIYKKEFKTEMEKDLRKEIRGYAGQILATMCRGVRDERKSVDDEKVSEDVMALTRDVKQRWASPSSVFTKLLVMRSYAHLRRVFAKYHAVCNHPIEVAIQKEMSKDFLCKDSLLDLLLSMIACIKDEKRYFAIRLRQAIVTIDDDGTLDRIIVSRSEIDLLLIKNKFHELCKKKLSDVIAHEISGDYKRVMLAIVKE